MPKFKVELKLQGLELKIEGERDDAALISRALGEQMAGLIQPAGPLLEGEVVRGVSSTVDSSVVASQNKRKAKRNRAIQATSDSEAPVAIDFVHDPQKFGSPTQSWKTAEKALWLLYVLKEAKEVGETSGRVITETYNKHFRQSGTITVSNVNRDLGRSMANAIWAGQRQTKNRLRSVRTQPRIHRCGS